MLSSSINVKNRTPGLNARVNLASRYATSGTRARSRRNAQFHHSGVGRLEYGSAVEG